MSISIVTPHRNMTNTIRKTISTVKNCGEHVREHIIVDDASSKSQKKILIKIIKNTNCKLVSLKKNHGPVSAFNKGCKLATGDFILALAADDWISKKNIKYIFKATEKYKSFGLIIPKNKILYNVNSKYIEINKFSNSKKLVLKSPLNWMIKGFYNKVNGQALVNRKVIKKIGFYNKNLDMNCDHFSHAFAALNSGIVVLPHSLTCFIKRSNSFGHSINIKRQYESLKNLFRILNKKKFNNLKTYYVKSGCLGKEPHALKVCILLREYSFLNTKFFLSKFLFYFFRSIVRPFVLKIKSA